MLNAALIPEKEKKGNSTTVPIEGEFERCERCLRSSFGVGLGRASGRRRRRSNGGILDQLLQERTARLLLPPQEAEREHGAHFGPPRPRVGLLLRYHLAVPIPGQVHAVVPRQEPARVPHVPEERVAEHEAGLEGVEEPLVPEDGVERLERGEVVQPHRHAAQVLDEPVHAARQDEQHARVHGDERGGDGAGVDAGAGAPRVEDGGQEDEDEDDGELDGERGDGQAASELLRAVRRGRVGGEGDS